MKIDVPFFHPHQPRTHTKRGDVLLLLPLNLIRTRRTDEPKSICPTKPQILDPVSSPNPHIISIIPYRDINHMQKVRESNLCPTNDTKIDRQKSNIIYILYIINKYSINIFYIGKLIPNTQRAFTFDFSLRA